MSYSFKNTLSRSLFVGLVNGILFGNAYIAKAVTVDFSTNPNNQTLGYYGVPYGFIGASGAPQLYPYCPPVTPGGTPPCAATPALYTDTATQNYPGHVTASDGFLVQSAPNNLYDLPANTNFYALSSEWAPSNNWDYRFDFGVSGGTSYFDFWIMDIGLSVPGDFPTYWDASLTYADGTSGTEEFMLAQGGFEQKRFLPDVPGGRILTADITPPAMQPDGYTSNDRTAAWGVAITEFSYQVPEPGSIALFGTAMLLLWGRLAGGSKVCRFHRSIV